MPIECFEEPQIVRYEFGQQFSWHYDAIPKSLQNSSGNRIATLLVYLNDVKSGGATCFKDLNIQVRPVKGKALLFFPSFKDGKPDDRTMHAGQVAMDTKWIAQM
jgi:prolyl 4-hydroxylase